MKGWFRLAKDDEYEDHEGLWVGRGRGSWSISLAALEKTHCLLLQIRVMMLLLIIIMMNTARHGMERDDGKIIWLIIPPSTWKSSKALCNLPKAVSSTFPIWRSVGSDAQLSCTETRFQKCSKSGKNGSKHPMLSISMAYNVIGCKKIERNSQKIKIADFTILLFYYY